MFAFSREKWIQELKSFSKKVPVVLVGTQSDLREDAKTLVQVYWHIVYTF